MPLEKLKLLKKLASYLGIILGLLSLNFCSQDTALPIYGNRDLDEQGDTIYHTIPDFSFVNQYNQKITQENYKGKVYIADFFFATCPGICPIMTRELTRVQKALQAIPEKVEILSHTVDPEADSTAALLAYGKEKGADFSTWNFVTGSKKKLYQMAASYLVVANEDAQAEIKFVHSDKLVLIDKQGRIRGLYSGIETREVDQLIKDIKTLTREPWKQSKKTKP